MKFSLVSQPLVHFNVLPVWCRRRCIALSLLRKIRKSGQRSYRPCHDPPMPYSTGCCAVVHHSKSRIIFIFSLAKSIMISQSCIKLLVPFIRCNRKISESFLTYFVIGQIIVDGCGILLSRSVCYTKNGLVLSGSVPI